MKQLISILVIIAFTLNSTVYGNIPTDSSIQNPLSSFSLPVHLGTITETFTGNSRQHVVIIQDHHCNYEAQLKIAQMIPYIKGVSSLPAAVLVEGATGQVDSPLFQTFPDKGILTTVMNDFAQKGLITGPEYALLTSHKKNLLSITGIENADIYTKDFKCYRKTLLDNDRVVAFFSLVAKAQKTLKRLTYNKELKAFDRQWQSYTKLLTGVDSFATYLTTFVESKDMITGQFGTLLKCINQEKSINYDVIEDENTKLLTWLIEHEDKSAISDIIQKGTSLSREEIAAVSYYGKILDFFVKHAELKKAYPQLYAYCTFIRDYESIDLETLDQELTTLQQMVRHKLYETKEEKQLDKEIAKTELLKKLLTLSLSREELHTYSSDKKSFSPEIISQFFVTRLSTHNKDILATSLEEFNFSDLHKHIDHADNFYSYALQRDNIIFQALKDKIATYAGEIVLITGGFHAPLIRKKLQESNISYTFVLPRIEGEKGGENYRTLMLSNLFSSPGTEALAFPSIFNQLIDNIGETLQAETIVNIVAELKDQLQESDSFDSVIKQWITTLPQIQLQQLLDMLSSSELGLSEEQRTLILQTRLIHEYGKNILSEEGLDTDLDIQMRCMDLNKDFNVDSLSDIYTALISSIEKKPLHTRIAKTAKNAFAKAGNLLMRLARREETEEKPNYDPYLDIIDASLDLIPLEKTFLASLVKADLIKSPEQLEQFVLKLPTVRRTNIASIAKLEVAADIDKATENYENIINEFIENPLLLQVDTFAGFESVVHERIKAGLLVNIDRLIDFYKLPEFLKEKLHESHRQELITTFEEAFYLTRDSLLNAIKESQDADEITEYATIILNLDNQDTEVIDYLIQKCSAFSVQYADVVGSVPDIGLLQPDSDEYIRILELLKNLETVSQFVLKYSPNSTAAYSYKKQALQNAVEIRYTIAQRTSNTYFSEELRDTLLDRINRNRIKDLQFLFRLFSRIGHVIQGPEYHYTITDWIGSGGFAEVWKAVDRNGKEVAIKLPVEDSPLYSNSIMEETRWIDHIQTKLSASDTELPVPKVYAQGNTPEGYFIAMELLGGISFEEGLRQLQAQWQNKVPSTPQELLLVKKIMVKLSTFLESIHEAEVIHHDIKPANIMIEFEYSPDGKTITDVKSVKYIDFGISSFADEQPGLAGTPSYMAPETILGAQQDITTDYFQLGVVFYRLLFGNGPFHNPTPFNNQNYLPAVMDSQDIIERYSEYAKDRQLLRKFNDRAKGYVFNTLFHDPFRSIQETPENKPFIDLLRAMLTKGEISEYLTYFTGTEDIALEYLESIAQKRDVSSIKKALETLDSSVQFSFEARNLGEVTLKSLKHYDTDKDEYVFDAVHNGTPIEYAISRFDYNERMKQQQADSSTAVVAVVEIDETVDSVSDDKIMVAEVEIEETYESQSNRKTQEQPQDASQTEADRITMQLPKMFDTAQAESETVAVPLESQTASPDTQTERQADSQEEMETQQYADGGQDIKKVSFASELPTMFDTQLDNESELEITEEPVTIEEVLELNSERRIKTGEAPEDSTLAIFRPFRKWKTMSDSPVGSILNFLAEPKLVAPIWEEVVFRLFPLGLMKVSFSSILAFDPLGIGMTLGASVGIFSAAHVVVKWLVERDKPKDLQTYATFSEAFQGFLKFLMPSILFTVTYIITLSLSAPFPFAAPFIALGINILAHSIYNTIVIRYSAIPFITESSTLKLLPRLWNQFRKHAHFRYILNENLTLKELFSTEGASGLIYEANDGTNNTFLVKAARGPRLSIYPDISEQFESGWQREIARYDREIAANRAFQFLTINTFEDGITRKIPVTPAFYGEADINGNPAFALEEIPGNHLSELPKDIQKELLADPNVLIEKALQMVEKMYEAGFFIDDIQFIVVTEDTFDKQGKLLRKKGDPVFIDFGSAYPLDSMPYTIDNPLSHMKSNVEESVRFTYARLQLEHELLMRLRLIPPIYNRLSDILQDSSLTNTDKNDLIFTLLNSPRESGLDLAGYEQYLRWFLDWLDNVTFLQLSSTGKEKDALQRLTNLVFSDPETVLIQMSILQPDTSRSIIIEKIHALKNIADTDNQSFITEDVAHITDLIDAFDGKVLESTHLGLSQKYGIIELPADDFLLQKTGGAFHFLNAKDGIHYIFISEDSKYKEDAIEHELFEMAWIEQIKNNFSTDKFQSLLEILQHIDPAIRRLNDTAIVQAAHILAWGEQIAANGWNKISDSVFVQSQIASMQEQDLTKLISENRLAHRTLQQAFLSGSYTSEQLKNIQQLEYAVWNTANFELFLREARQALDKKDLDIAIGFYKQALELSPENETAKKWLAISQKSHEWLEIGNSSLNDKEPLLKDLLKNTTPDERIEIAQLCASISPARTIAFIASFEFTTIVKQGEIIAKPGYLNALVKLAQTCAERSIISTVSNFKNFGLTIDKARDEIIRIATYCANKDSEWVSDGFENFGLTLDNARENVIEIATICAQENGSATAEHFENFGFTKIIGGTLLSPEFEAIDEYIPQIIEIAELCSRDSGTDTALHFNRFGLTLSNSGIAIYNLLLSCLANTDGPEDISLILEMLDKFGLTLKQLMTFVDSLLLMEPWLKQMFRYTKWSSILKDVSADKADLLTSEYSDLEELFSNNLIVDFDIDADVPPLSDADAEMARHFFRVLDGINYIEQFITTLLGKGETESAKILRNNLALLKNLEKDKPYKSNHPIRERMERAFFTLLPKIPVDLKKLRDTSAKKFPLRDLPLLYWSSNANKALLADLNRYFYTPTWISKDTRLKFSNFLLFLIEHDVQQPVLEEIVSFFVREIAAVSINKVSDEKSKSQQIQEILSKTIIASDIQVIKDVTKENLSAAMKFGLNNFYNESIRYFKQVFDLPETMDDITVFLDTYQGLIEPLLVYAEHMKRFGADEQLRYLRLFITRLIEGEDIYRKTRYSLNNDHLDIIFAYDDALSQNWQKNARADKKIFPSMQEGFLVEETDDSQILFEIGEIPSITCQSYNGDPNLSQCLLNIVLDGKNKVIIVRSSDGTIVGRALIRLLFDRNASKPVLFLEQDYSARGSNNGKNREYIFDYAFARAKELGLDLIYNGYGDVALKRKLDLTKSFPHELESYGGALSVEYVDAAGGRVNHTSTYILGADRYSIAQPARKITPYTSLELLNDMETGTIQIDLLPDSPGKNILNMLLDSDVPGVVYGGIVRDYLTDTVKEKGDVDLFLQIDIPVSELNSENIMDYLEPAAKAFHLSPEEFVYGKDINGVIVDFLGFIDKDGNVRMIDRLGEQFFNVPEISINKIGISTDGTVFDPFEGLKDVRDKRLRLAGNKAFSNYQVVFRTIRFLLQMQDSGYSLDDTAKEIVFGFFRNELAETANWNNTIDYYIKRTTYLKKEISGLYARVLDKINKRASLGDVYRYIDKELAALNERYSETKDPAYEQFMVQNQSRMESALWKLFGINPFNPIDLVPKQHWFIRFIELFFGIRLKNPMQQIVDIPVIDIDSAEGQQIIGEAIDSAYPTVFSQNTQVTLVESKRILAKDKAGIGRMITDVYLAADNPAEATKLLRKAGAEPFLRSLNIELQRIDEQLLRKQLLLPESPVFENPLNTGAFPNEIQDINHVREQFDGKLPHDLILTEVAERTNFYKTPGESRHYNQIRVDGEDFAVLTSRKFSDPGEDQAYYEIFSRIMLDELNIALPSLKSPSAIAYEEDGRMHIVTKYVKAEGDLAVEDKLTNEQKAQLFALVLLLNLKDVNFGNILLNNESPDDPFLYLIDFDRWTEESWEDDLFIEMRLGRTPYLSRNSVEENKEIIALTREILNSSLLPLLELKKESIIQRLSDSGFTENQINNYAEMVDNQLASLEQKLEFARDTAINYLEHTTNNKIAKAKLTPEEERQVRDALANGEIKTQRALIDTLKSLKVDRPFTISKESHGAVAQDRDKTEVIDRFNSAIESGAPKNTEDVSDNASTLTHEQVALLKGALHDTNNIIAALLGTVDFMLSRTIENPEIRKLLLTETAKSDKYNNQLVQQVLQTGEYADLLNSLIYKKIQKNLQLENPDPTEINQNITDILTQLDFMTLLVELVYTTFVNDHHDLYKPSGLLLRIHQKLGEIETIKDIYNEALSGQLSDSREFLSLNDFSDYIESYANELATVSLSNITVSINKYHLKRILKNLIINAREALTGSKNDSIFVSSNINTSTNMVEIKITDNGKGIAADALKNIFIPGFTTKDASARERGIGLDMVKRMVEHAGGTIRVESTVGEGTTFTVSFPMLTPEERMENYFERHSKYSNTQDHDVQFSLPAFIISNENYGALLEMLNAQPEEKKGGVYAGVSFEQNMSIILAQQPDIAVFTDRERTVPELLLPVVSELLQRYPSRLEFLSILFGKKINRDLLTGSTSWDITQLLDYLDSCEDQVPTVLDEIISLMPETLQSRAREFWVFQQESGQGIIKNYFSLQKYKSFIDSLEDTPLNLHWLATADNFSRLRQYFIENRVISISSNWNNAQKGPGEAIRRISKDFGNFPVKLLYLSNMTGSTVYTSKGNLSKNIQEIMDRTGSDPAIVSYTILAPVFYPVAEEFVQWLNLVAVSIIVDEKKNTKLDLTHIAFILLARNQENTKLQMDTFNALRNIDNYIKSTPVEYTEWLANWTESIYNAQKQVFPTNTQGQEIEQFIAHLRGDMSEIENLAKNVMNLNNALIAESSVSERINQLLILRNLLQNIDTNIIQKNYQNIFKQLLQKENIDAVLTESILKLSSKHSTEEWGIFIHDNYPNLNTPSLNALLAAIATLTQEAPPLIQEQIKLPAIPSSNKSIQKAA